MRSAVLGCKLPGPGCLYLNQTSNFRAPVKLGETTCHVGDTLVVDGSALLWVPSRGS